MRRKVSWLFVWTNLVFWLGQAGGCSTPWENQNYKIADEPAGIDSSVPIEPGPEVQRLRVEADPQTPTPSPAPAAPSGSRSQANEAHAGEPQPPAQPSTPPVPPAPSAPVAPPKPAAAPAPSDRSAWSVVTVAAAPGTTTHGPLYFQDHGFTHRDFSPPPTSDSPESALLGPESSGWNGPNLAALAIEPINFLVDFVVFPFRAVVKPPFSTVTTPAKQANAQPAPGAPKDASRTDTKAGAQPDVKAEVCCGFPAGKPPVSP